MPKKILIAEDDRGVADVLQKTLEYKGYDVVRCADGLEALETLEYTTVDLVLTDWMMPKMDGIELIRKIRQTLEPAPLIVMFTAIGSPEARRHAMSCGADGFLAKPCKARDIIQCIENLFARRERTTPTRMEVTLDEQDGPIPPFCCIGIVASTGGPTVLNRLVKILPAFPSAAFLVVLHAPRWVLEELEQTLQRRTSMNVLIAADGQEIKPGAIYLLPPSGESFIRGNPPRLFLVESEDEDFIESAADPLFKSIAEIHGRRSVGVVLTGMGVDGARGTQYISAAGGEVFVQDPATTPASAKPRSVIDSNPSAIVLTIEDLPNTLSRLVDKLVGA